MPTTYGNDIVYCLKSHCGVRGYCRQKWVLQVQIICKFSNERTCKRNKDVQGLSCGFEVYKTLSRNFYCKECGRNNCQNNYYCNIMVYFLQFCDVFNFLSLETKHLDS